MPHHLVMLLVACTATGRCTLCHESFCGLFGAIATTSLGATDICWTLLGPRLNQLALPFEPEPLDIVLVYFLDWIGCRFCCVVNKRIETTRITGKSEYNDMQHDY
eukprot:3865161-Amphidinium_carterae.1